VRIEGIENHRRVVRKSIELFQSRVLLSVMYASCADAKPGPPVREADPPLQSIDTEHRPGTGREAPSGRRSASADTDVGPFKRRTSSAIVQSMSALTVSGTSVHARLSEAAIRVASDLTNGCFAAARADFLDTFRPDVARELIECELTALLRNEAAPTKRAPAGELRIVSEQHADLRLRIIGPAARAGANVATLTRNTMVGNTGSAPAVIRRWYQPQPFPNDVFDASKAIEAMPDVTLRAGEALALRAGFDAYEIVAPDRAAIMFVLGGESALPLAWSYRRDTRLPVAAQPVAREWLRVRELLAFSTALNDASLVPAITELAHHPSHFVRWAAGAAAARLAPEASATMLHALAADAHPQVRAAAQQLLAQRAMQ
jgi:hypothetical protein